MSLKKIQICSFLFLSVRENNLQDNSFQLKLEREKKLFLTVISIKIMESVTECGYAEA